jgi:hypothetical protein
MRYIAYIFKHGMFLESVKYGNATYVFGKNWDTCSKMTKNEMLDNRLQKARIIRLCLRFGVIGENHQK